MTEEARKSVGDGSGETFDERISRLALSTDGITAPRGLEARTTPRKRRPLAASTRATALPRKPATPVTMVMSCAISGPCRGFGLTP